MIGSAEDERAEKIKKEVKSAVQRIAPLLKIDVTFNSGLLSEVYFYLSASCASPFFPMTRPLALEVCYKSQPRLGACILDAVR